jgi:Zn-dependent protease with chaperone function
MSLAETISRKKWNSFALFLILDVVQIAFVSLLILDESTPLIVSIGLGGSNPFTTVLLFIGIVFAQSVMIYLVAMSMLRKEGMVELYPTFDASTKWRCQYSRDDLVKWTQELAEKSGVSVDRVFIMRSPLPNAFTFSLPLIGTVIVIHTNLLDVLGQSEVMSVIAHELGHVKNADSLISIIVRMPAIFVDLIYLYVYVRLGLGVASSLLVNFDLFLAAVRLGVLIAFFIASRMIMSGSIIFAQRASREAELLADLHAAEVLGAEATINGLIRLGQRAEAVTALVSEIRWLESLNPERMNPLTNAELNQMILSYPLDAIDEVNARQMAPWVFLTTRLTNMRDVYGVEISNQQIKDAVAPAAQNLLAQRKKETHDESSTGPKNMVVDWRKADSDGDRRLSTDELVDLLAMLRENPSKMMFDSEVGRNLLMIDHPDFRRRVISLADAFNL